MFCREGQRALVYRDLRIVACHGLAFGLGRSTMLVVSHTVGGGEHPCFEPVVTIGANDDITGSIGVTAGVAQAAGGEVTYLLYTCEVALKVLDKTHTSALVVLFGIHSLGSLYIFLAVEY